MSLSPVEVAVRDLPVGAVLGDLSAALGPDGSAVLVAPPGTGKTTLLPPALAGLIPGLSSFLRPGETGGAGRVVVAQPRRIAARAAARRIAGLFGEQVGGRVGFSVRGQSVTSASTRVEVVTTGLLVQRMQRDPELPGVSAVMIDECHERHLDTDLALAFAVDIRATLRPDLLLLATSATAEAERIAALIGSPRPVRASGALFSVETMWCPPAAGITPPLGLRVDPRFLDHVADVVARAVGQCADDLLVFLPGAGEISAVGARLARLLGTGANSAGRRGGQAGDIDLLALHGRLPAAEQDAALTQRAGRRRVVLATDVAESSLTVPGVRTVVDAGLARVPRIDLARGLGSLVTVRASRAAGTQRAGRAGRQGPGRVYRCWSAADDERRPDHPEPQVATADLTGFVLNLACWGTADGSGLALLDPPPAAALEVATATLRDLGAVDEAGRATARGRALARVGTHPRLARALVDGADIVGARRAAEVVALLNGDLAGGRDDLAALWRAMRQGHDPAAAASWRDETARLRRAVPASSDRPATGPPPAGRPLPGRAPTDRLADEPAAAIVVGLAFPERLARLRRADGRTYLMASGTAADLTEGSGLTGAPWLAVAVADRPAGRRDARIRLAVPLDEATAREVGAPLLRRGPEVAWADSDVRADDVERLGAVVLVRRRLDRVDPVAAAAAVAEGLRREGLGLLRWTPAAVALRARLAACHAGLGEPWPAVDDESLLAGLDLAGARSRADLRRVDVVTALRRLLDHGSAGRLDEVAPERVRVPTGSRIAVDYSDPAAPALPVRLQEVFGWARAPRVAGRPLRLRLLSPAGRPVAVTSDLASFWSSGYPAVRAELRGRYPRHPWPQDPGSAVPTRGTAPWRH